MPQLDAAATAELLAAAQVCDGLVKGLRHPGWPDDPWDALKRLALLLLERTRPSRARAGATSRLALTAGALAIRMRH